MTLRLGSLQLDVPVVLAPMAGITDYPFRALCRGFGAGLYVSEMVTARPLVQGSRKSERIATFGPDEPIRSIQLYAREPDAMADAVRLLVERDRVDHIDLNFGCPMPKVTRKGGGAAVPLQPLLLGRLIGAAVSNAGTVPVTMKMRMGIDEDRLYYVEAGRIAEREGASAVCLHARTALQMYSGTARWEAISRLREALEIPVLGNGDVWSVDDAQSLMEQTGCHGVVIGRGCLGRPWFFQQLAEAFKGEEVRAEPNFEEVRTTMLEHVERLVAWFGETSGIRRFRKHASWYVRDFSRASAERGALVRAESVENIRAVLGVLDGNESPNSELSRVPRGPVRGTARVRLPPRP